MTVEQPGPRHRVPTPVALGLLAVALAAGIAVGTGAAAIVGPTPTATSVPPSAPSGAAGSSAPSTPTPAPTASVAPTPPPTPEPTPSPAPTPTPEPTPQLVPAPLTGVLVTPEAARRHPIAVMIDDHSAARPQSGFNAASVVWQAPAEGGIPRYMLIFQENVPATVGPVRSARQYYIEWASEWRALYVHSGGSPQAKETLQAKGNGQLVYNADEFRWGGRYLWRATDRPAPHNVYTDGEHLRALAKRLKATDGPLEAAWTFGPETPLRERPVGGRIETAYPANRIRYDYDRATNSYVRSVRGQSPQKDRADGDRVAPKNVVVMLVRFGPLNDGHPNKKRLEAANVGSGTAWISTGGRTIKGTWRKASTTAPTRFFDRAGKPVTLTPGQTFIQVMPTGTKVTVTPGKLPPVPRTRGAGSAWPGRRGRVGVAGSAWPGRASSRAPLLFARPACGPRGPGPVLVWPRAPLALPRRGSALVGAARVRLSRGPGAAWGSSRGYPSSPRAARARPWLSPASRAELSLLLETVRSLLRPKCFSFRTDSSTREGFGARGDE